MKRILAALLTVTLLAFAACTSAEEKAPALLGFFESEDLSGASVDASVLQNAELTMVNVWATHCSPCLREMPDLGELAAAYKEDGVQIIGLVIDVLSSDASLDSTMLDTARDIVSATKADYLHIVPTPSLFPLVAQIASVPTTFFVDANGVQVGTAYIGNRDKETWAQIIEETLELVQK